MEPLELIQDYLERHTDNPPPSLTEETRLDTLGIDSLAMYELLFELEDTYGVRFTDDTARPETIGELIRFIESTHPAAKNGTV